MWLAHQIVKLIEYGRANSIEHQTFVIARVGLSTSSR